MAEAGQLGLYAAAAAGVSSRRWLMKITRNYH